MFILLVLLSKASILLLCKVLKNGCVHSLMLKLKCFDFISNKIFFPIPYVLCMSDSHKIILLLLNFTQF
jgi:hypothetical protein